MSRPSRSRTAFRYSARFSRWNGSVRPGSGFARPAAIELGFEPRREAVVRRLVGTRRPAGGIRPARSFRTTFSHTAASAATREVERVERDGHRAALFLPRGVTGQTVAVERRAVGGDG